MSEAARVAGFVTDTNDRRLHFVCELMATVVGLWGMNALTVREHDTLLVIDCGHAMIDSTIYEVERENPLRCKELTEPTGDVCG